MFHLRTVLVLGAGASAPFGLPVGSALRDELANVTYNANPTLNRLRAQGLSESELVEFQERFARSGLTIDNFVARQPSYDRLARLGITASLLPKESDGALFGARTNQVTGRVNGSSDWYQSLWLHMLRDIGGHADLARNDLKVITFNYDRTFERYLHQAAKATFGISDEEALFAVSRFFPHHVYGMLGPYSGDGAVPFGGGEVSDAARAAESLSLMPNIRPKADARAKRILESAQQIFFLGFSFDEMNCLRIGLREIFLERQQGPLRPPELFATTYGMNRYEVEQAALQITPRASDLTSFDGPCRDAIREWAPQLSRRP